MEDPSQAQVTDLDPLEDFLWEMTVFIEMTKLINFVTIFLYAR